MNVKEKITEIESKIEQCLRDKKEANVVIDLLCYSQEKNPSVALAAVQGLQQVFTNFFDSGDLSLTTSSCDKDKDPAHSQLCEWLKEQYHTTCRVLVETLSSPDKKLQKGALVAILEFMEMETEQPNAGQLAGFDLSGLMQRMVDILLAKIPEPRDVIEQLGTHTVANDVRYSLMKSLKNNLRKTPMKERTRTYLRNVLTMIFSIQLPEGDTPLRGNVITAAAGVAVEPEVLSLKAHKKLFTACLMTFLRSDLAPKLYHNVLAKLDNKHISFLSSPLLLADFLTRSFKIGGVCSLLALNGLFTLISKYNLDYPGFYKKLYSLFQPDIYVVEHCAQFFYLANVFLSSTHLSAHLVAGFIKRVIRMALVAPPVGAKMSLVFVQAMLKRHPACMVLVHRPGHFDPSDPYLPDQKDPALSRALDSSLWEIQTLEIHYSPEVVLEALKIRRPVKEERDMAEAVKDSTKRMVERAVKKAPTVNVPLSHDKPTSLFDSHYRAFFALQ